MHLPFFSIIIPTYNRASLIQKTISAFLEQSFKDFELIIVDDGSTDNTQEVVKKFNNAKIKYFYIANSERGAARNFGARQAHGSYLNFFDSDDSPYENHLSNAYEFIQRNKLPKVFNVGYQIVDSNDNIVKKETNFNYDINRRLIKTNFFACNSIFINREIFLENLFNESRALASAEDWELWLRISAKYRIVSSDKITFQMNNHAARSLFTISPFKVAERDTLLINLLLDNNEFKSIYRKNISTFISERYTFCALSFSLVKGQKFNTMKFLKMALKQNALMLFRKRFWAVVKHLIIK